MNTERASNRVAIGLIIDSLLMIGSFFAVYYLRQPFDSAPFKKLAPISDYYWLLGVCLPFSWISLLAFGAYSSKPRARWQFVDLFARVCLAMLFVLSLIFFVFRVHEVNRTLVFPFVMISASLFVLWRVLLLRWQIAKGISRKVLLVGDGDRFPLIVDEFKVDPFKGFHVIGCLTDSAAPGSEIRGLRVLGNLHDLYNVLHKEVVDEVIFGIELAEMERYRTLLKICETVGVNMLILIDYIWPRISRIETGKLLNRPYLYFASNAVNEVESWTKEILDRAVALVALVFTSPVMLLVALLVKVFSPGPILFVQERTGLNGRKFHMYKFRTMHAGAEKRKAELQNMNQMNGPVFKMKNDPRVTGIGSWLRKYSLDELPQLFNVLKGDMSLVGPRPLPCDEASMIHGMQRRRFSVKPGLTCIWQISGRNHLTYDEWMDLDLQYVDKWSLGLDLKILLKTPAAIFSSKGAF